MNEVLDWRFSFNLTSHLFIFLQLSNVDVFKTGSVWQTDDSSVISIVSVDLVTLVHVMMQNIIRKLLIEIFITLSSTT